MRAQLSADRCVSVYPSYCNFFQLIIYAMITMIIPMFRLVDWVSSFPVNVEANIVHSV